MEAVVVQFHTFLNTKPVTDDRSTAYCMKLVEAQLHTFLTSAPDTLERSTAHRMEAADLQLNTILNSATESRAVNCTTYGGSRGTAPHIHILKTRYS